MLLSRALLKRHSVLPGFDLALGFTLLYLSFIVLVPLSAAFLKTFTMTWPAFWGAVTAPRVVASYRLTFGASFAAALVNAVFGLVVCWVLVRYEFPGRRFVDALVDLPLVSEITPLLIITKLEQFDVPGATAIAVVMLVAAFLMLLAINGLQAWTRSRQGR